MKNLFIKIIITLLLMFNLTAFWADTWEQYTRYRSVDVSTFKEYGFKITKEFFVLKNSYDVNNTLDISSLSRLALLIKKSANYLPDDIQNDAYYTDVLSAIERAKKNPDNDSSFIDVTKKLAQYLKKVKISAITWKVTAIPSKWNAPLVTTLKADVVDPEGTLIPKNNYVWWIDLGGKKKILWNGPSINYTFKEQWKYWVFVDVRSNHKNKKWYTDVLSYRWKVDIDVLSKIASVIVKVNWDRVWDKTELKFTPDDARYWLIFDATSTVPTWKAKIIKTSWDFGNGIKKEYSRWPKVERVSYYKQWTYNVVLKMTTNLWDIITKKFTLFINDPIATINVKPLTWYLWDKFTFSAKTAANNKDLSYNWEIVDIVDDKVVFKKQAKVFTYEFPNKGYFNVRLKVDSPYLQTNDIDSKIIYIGSRAPIVNLNASIPESNKPNRVLLDATNTFDPDYTDNWKLKYSWLIDWERVKLENTNKDSSLWYYTFDSIWEHDITLEVTDPDNVKWLKTIKFKINSILSVDFKAEPRVIARGQTINFKAISKQAVIYEWDFWDWTSKWWNSWNISHTYDRSWKFTVKLTVEDASWNRNSFSKTIYVWDWKNPVAIIDLLAWANGTPAIEKWVCKWHDAYIINRIENIQFDAWESIDVTGNNTWLDYSFKIWNDKYFRARTISYKFDELGCFPVKLTVTSKKTQTSNSKQIWLKVQNLKPTLSALSTKIENPDSDPIIVDLSAVWAKDKDWVITSYLWYYYTDSESEPQDFRVTTSPSTKFVLPKITWNYYFVVVLTDDNWDKINSEQLWKEATLTLAWNNINVPLVDLKVNDSSVYIWDDVVFSAKVKNILWRNITSKSKFYWDFDGDWFYDQESTIPTVSHIYKKSWTFYAKLKVKHKWFSNTRTVEIDVENRLSPDFKYISVWSTFLFLNNSKWVYSFIIWDLWDWTKVEWKQDFKHIYKDWKPIHIVKLKLIEWTKIKQKEYRVVKNMMNLLKTKKWNFVVLSYPGNKDWKIIVKQDSDYIYIYPSVKNKDVSIVAIDTNTDVDSDLNWWKDDDVNIKWKPGSILKVKLNKNRIQNIVVFIKDKDWIVLDSKQLSIEKEYIEVSNEDISKIKFLNVSDKQKKQIEILKSMISGMPSNEKVKSMKYLKQLQDEWSDDTEKTKVILAFEAYLDETSLTNKNDIINLLEWLLVANQEDKSEKNIAYNALKNLIPNDIVCSGTWALDTSKINNANNWFSKCKLTLIDKLNAIKVSDDIDLNRTLAKDILRQIVGLKSLTNEQKLNFKAILSTFVYGWVKNIPKQEKNNIEKQTQNITNSTSGFDFMWIIKNIIYIILWIIWLLLFITWLFFIYYKVTNKDENIGFSDFILKKTKSNDNEVNKDDSLLDDIDLSDKSDTLDDLWDIDNSQEKHEDKIEDKNQEIKKVDTSNETVPDWLKWVESDVNDSKAVVEQSNIVEKKDNWDIKLENQENNEVKQDGEIKQVKIDDQENDDSVPDWLKWSIWISDNQDENNQNEELKNNKIDQEINKVEKDDIQNQSKDIIQDNGLDDSTEKLLTDDEIDKEISLKEEKWDIPDWLKDSLQQDDNKKQDIKEEVIKEEKWDIPDWLKDSLQQDDNKKQDIKEDVIKEENKEDNIENQEKETKEELDKKSDDNKQEKIVDDKKIKQKKTRKRTSKKSTTIKKVKKEDNEENIKQKEDKFKKDVDKKQDLPSKNDKKSDELWDDWMEIPDWLKSE